jgi:putative hydrolase of the HAD superfamily
LALNIVFDFGGVVFIWDPRTIVTRVFSDEIDIQKAISVFSHPDWLEFDRGTITIENLVKNITARTGLPFDKVIDMIRHIPLTLKPTQETIDLIYEMKDKGHNVYALTNMPHMSMAHFESEYKFMKIFNGIVASCRIHMVKPEPEIYHYLLDKYELDPQETIFIDDTTVNLSPASSLGIRTIEFKNPAQCRNTLELYGA